MSLLLLLGLLSQLGLLLLRSRYTRSRSGKRQIRNRNSKSMCLDLKILCLFLVPAHQLCHVLFHETKTLSQRRPRFGQLCHVDGKSFFRLPVLLILRCKQVFLGDILVKRRHMTKISGKYRFYQRPRVNSFSTQQNKHRQQLRHTLYHALCIYFTQLLAKAFLLLFLKC